MPIDLPLLRLGPQALAAAQQAQQNVAQSSGSPSTPQASPQASEPDSSGSAASGGGGGSTGDYSKFDPNPTLLGRIIFGNAAHNQYLSQVLQNKYQQDLLQKKQQFMLSTAKQQAELQTWTNLVNQGGTRVFNSPEAQKYFHKDPELYDAMKQKAQLVDQQQVLGGVLNALIAHQAGINVTSQQAAQMSPDQTKMLAEAQKMKFEQTKQGVELAKEGFSLQKSKIELTKAGVELQKAMQDKSDKASQKQQDALQKFVDGLGKNRDGLLAKYNALNADGSPKYDDKAKQAAMDNWNKSLDAQKKRAEQAGIDLGQYKLDYSAGDAGYKVLGHKFGGTPGTLGQSAPDTAPQVPTGEGAANASFNPTATVKSKSGRPMTKGKDGKWYYADSSTS